MFILHKPPLSKNYENTSSSSELKKGTYFLQEKNEFLNCAIKLTISYYENLSPLTSEEQEEMRKLMLEEKLQHRNHQQLLLNSKITKFQNTLNYEKTELSTFLAFQAAEKRLKILRTQIFRRSRKHHKKLEILESQFSNYKEEEKEIESEKDKFFKYLEHIAKFKVFLKYRKSSYLPVSHYLQIKQELKRKEEMKKISSNFEKNSNSLSAEQIMKYFTEENKRRVTHKHALKFKYEELQKKLRKLEIEKQSSGGISKQNQVESHTTGVNRKLSKVDFEHLMIENSEMREKLGRMNREVVVLKKRIVSLKQFLNQRQTMLVEKISVFHKLFKKSELKEKSVRSLKKEIIITQNSKIEEMKYNRRLRKNQDMYNVPKTQDYLKVKQTVSELRKKICDWKRKFDISANNSRISKSRFIQLKRKKRVYSQIYGSSRPNSVPLYASGLGGDAGNNWVNTTSPIFNSSSKNIGDRKRSRRVLKISKKRNKLSRSTMVSQISNYSNNKLNKIGFSRGD